MSKDISVRKELRNLIAFYRKHNKACKAQTTPTTDNGPSGFTKSFKANYFNTKKSGKVLFSERVNEVAISYPYDQGQGFTINSQHFGATWTGTVTAKKSVTKVLHIFQAWSKTRVVIDGNVVFDKENEEGRVRYDFSAGTHDIVIEYENNWHTTDFYVRFLDPRPSLNVEELRNVLQEPLKQNPLLYYGGVYGTYTHRGETLVRLKPTSRPVILFLATYDPVRWKIEEAFAGQVLAIVFSSYSVATHVHMPPAEVPVYYTSWETIFPADEIIPQCEVHDHSGSPYFYCETDPNEMLTTMANVELMTGRRLDGVTAQYDPAVLNVPAMIFDDASYQAVVDELTDLASRLGYRS
jgi:hypothetical protein